MFYRWTPLNQEENFGGIDRLVVPTPDFGMRSIFRLSILIMISLTQQDARYHGTAREPNISVISTLVIDLKHG